MENQTLYSLLMKAAERKNGWDLKGLAIQVVNEEWKAGKLAVDGRSPKWSEVLWNLEGALLAIKDEEFRKVWLAANAQPRPQNTLHASF